MNAISDNYFLAVNFPLFFMYKGMLTTTTTTAKPTTTITTTATTSTVKPTTSTTVLTSTVKPTTISTVKSVVYYKPSDDTTSDAVHRVIIQGIESGLFFHMLHPFISCSSCLCLEIYHSMSSV